MLGPRGTGKSTWLEKIMPNVLRIDLLDVATLRTYITNPEYLEQVVLGAPQKQIMIDEVQKVPEMLSVVHRLIEMKREWQFILTGSSSRKLNRLIRILIVATPCSSDPLPHQILFQSSNPVQDTRL